MRALVYYKKAGVCLCVCLSQRNLFVCPRPRGTQLHPATILEYLLLYFVHDLLGLSPTHGLNFWDRRPTIQQPKTTKQQQPQHNQNETRQRNNNNATTINETTQQQQQPQQQQRN